MKGKAGNHPSFMIRPEFMRAAVFPWQSGAACWHDPARQPVDQKSGSRMPRLAEARGEPRRIMKAKSVERAYALARERYAELGIDTGQAIRRLARVPLSVHCWQGDDVGGFETAGGTLGDGLAVTGNYPGKARTADQLRADFEKALALVPGTHRFNLHACYAEMGARRVDRDALSAAQFKNWIAWAKARKIALDFNQTYFSHPKVDGGRSEERRVGKECRSRGSA